jgi:hypothetical protein
MQMLLPGNQIFCKIIFSRWGAAIYLQREMDLFYIVNICDVSCSKALL